MLGLLTAFSARQLCCAASLRSQLLAPTSASAFIRAFHKQPAIPLDAAPHELITGEKLFAAGTPLDNAEPALERARRLAVPGTRTFRVPVASNIAFYCTGTCDINIITGVDHEAVAVDAKWEPGTKESPLFTFRQLGPELEVFQWRHTSKDSAQHSESVLTVHIPERFCSLTIYDGGNISVAKVKEAAFSIHTRTGNVSFGSVSATHAHIIAEKGSVVGGALTAADVVVAAGGGFKVDKLTGLRMDVAQGAVAGGSARIGAVYCEKKLHIECLGASDGLHVNSLSTGEGGAALVQHAENSPVEVGGFEGACLGVWARGGAVSFHALRAARRVFVDSGGGAISGEFVSELREGPAAAAVLAHTGPSAKAQAPSLFGKLAAAAVSRVGFAAPAASPSAPPASAARLLQPELAPAGGGSSSFQPAQLCAVIDGLADSDASDADTAWRRVPVEAAGEPSGFAEEGDRAARADLGSGLGFDVGSWSGLGSDGPSGEGSRGERRKAALDELGAAASGHRAARVLLAPGGGGVSARERSWRDAWLAGLTRRSRE